MRDNIALVRGLHGEFTYLLSRCMHGMLPLVFGCTGSEVTKHTAHSVRGQELG